MLIQPEETTYSKAGVHTFAEEVAEHCGYTVGADLDDFVESIGGKVIYQDMWSLSDSIDGSLVVNAPENFIIYLPQHTGSLRDRFTIAHELGHYFVHYMLKYSETTPSPKMKATRAGAGRIEWEANWFAGAFLMPSKEFKEIFNELNGNLVLLSDRLKVSIPAIQVRINTLGI